MPQSMGRGIPAPIVLNLFSDVAQKALNSSLLVGLRDFETVFGACRIRPHTMPGLGKLFYKDLGSGSRVARLFKGASDDEGPPAYQDAHAIPGATSATTWGQERNADRTTLGVFL